MSCRLYNCLVGGGQRSLLYRYEMGLGFDSESENLINSDTPQQDLDGPWFPTSIWQEHPSASRDRGKFRFAVMLA